jgi:C4-dicarboxylate transporter, DctM subunit
MTPFEIGLASVLVIVALIYLGIYIPVALALTSFVGVWLIRGNVDVAINMLALASTQAIADYVFGVIPLFVLMGMFASAAGLGQDAYQVAERGLRRLPGGLGLATVAGNTVFAAITGVTIASAAVFARISVPEMLKFGYQRKFAVGVVAGSSVLGMLIPPSVLLIIYAIIAEQSIGAMFIAGILPGLLLAGAYCIGILAMARLTPGFVYQKDRALSEIELEPMSPMDVVAKLAPSTILIVTVLGGIYGGVFTPTEAGAVGALLAMLVAILKGAIDLKKLWAIIVEAGAITASILFIVLAATMYSRMLGLSGLPTQISGFMSNLHAGYAVTIAIFVVLSVLLGTIIDSLSIILILVPLFIPLIKPFGADLIWFGIVAVVAVEIGLLTPPFGISCFVIRGALEDYNVRLGEVFAGALPFAGIMLFVLLLLILFPWISLALL